MASILPGDDFADVTRYARLTLLKAGVGRSLPTPVDDILACAELVVSQEITLDVQYEGFFTRSYNVLASALKKLMGLVDLRENTVYLNQNALPQRIVFLKFHEAGHKVLPWQREAYLYLDDESTLDSGVRDLFERQANRFAADLMFQIDRFDGDARELPLSIRSPLSLSKRYGASVHASIRRYVEQNREACAVLILERLPEVGPDGSRLRVKQVIESSEFSRNIRLLRWPDSVTGTLAEQLLSRRLYEDGEFILSNSDGRRVGCRYQSFDNGYNIFMLIYPTGSSYDRRSA